MDFFAHTYKDAQGFDAPPVHDPCAVAYVIDPTIVSTRKVPVNIELQGTLTLGMTVADFRAPAPADCHTSVAVDLDHERFWNLVTDALVNIGEPHDDDRSAGGVRTAHDAADVERQERARVTLAGVK
jgi:purine nucleosidase